MGTWDIGPFENDTAADFADALDETAMEERENLIRSALTRTVRTQDYLDSSEGVEAVAAAALIAAQFPGGEPISTSYGPDETLPAFAADLRALAVDALDRVLAEESELAELWDETVDGPRWRQSVDRLRAVLDPQPKLHEDPLFEI
ncbi:DUF4259 domain-containing protein [Streptomyces sp. CB01881]|uniref:DUF4259 domain-containing protein n=1 Tax=Streptomyces sp. CB01881 TaxID=2078691 RepID=UPI000CDC7085|nr:DUF4259 domain-containing protein [Streptomyces sp. CB01881]AUY52428.1 hypothetical protein C2142_29855 [Streptomyces sp. CB01881]AUY53635.1 hypothetical protein C2142_37850 [Streptomyces sp. CB01881]TYC68855.1 DUF4259 domain-containing protein [Streptomyces sp. CB01881]TYC72062.1 DUF4259 domain-containing protein [Streptomyces sp. CB01881]